MKNSLPTSNLEFRSDPARFELQNRLYLEVRDREGRLLNDDQVRQLPIFRPIDPKHPNQLRLMREWRWRTRSFRRFKRFFNSLRGPKTVLDLGCGNGWMALQLARCPDTTVWAVDVNLAELEQGARIAAADNRENIRFVFADVLDQTLPEQTFDLIVLAASVQYFPDLQHLLQVLNTLLKPAGQIHFLDSPFYATEALRQQAREGSRQYYENIGVPEMAGFYQHHLQADLEPYRALDLNAGPVPALLQRLRWLPPFPWMEIRIPAAKETN
ncbi:MAG: class I SAM-dependent methyltransferase [Bacteroidetes bacterium]|nr:MAG: class I SAM-dependent methyltransferase [Bacteroidota bacterium]